MPKPRGPKKPYVLLREAIPLDDDTLDSLLGLAVEDLHHPLDWRHAPDIGPEGIKAKNLVNDLYPKQVVEFINGEAIVNRVHGQEAKVQLSQFLHSSARHRNANEVTLKGSGFRRITMRNKRQRIIELLSNPQYNKEVVKVLKDMEDRKMGIIVSIITCADMSIESKKDHEKGLYAGLEVPSEVFNAPGANIGLSGNYTNTRNVDFKGTYKGEMLVACQYLQLQLLDAEPGFSPGRWVKKLFGSEDHRIDVSSVPINPLTHDVGVSNREIDGDLEELFNGARDETQEGQHEEAMNSVEVTAPGPLKIQNVRRCNTDETDIVIGAGDMDEDEDDFMLYL